MQIYVTRKSMHFNVTAITQKKEQNLSPALY